MIRPLRRSHYRIALLLALVVPAILVAALAARRETPVQPIPGKLLDAPGTPSPP
jgi:hypothetical protein